MEGRKISFRNQIKSGKKCTRNHLRANISTKFQSRLKASLRDTAADLSSGGEKKEKINFKTARRVRFHGWIELLEVWFCLFKSLDDGTWPWQDFNYKRLEAPWTRLNFEVEFRSFTSKRQNWKSSQYFTWYGKVDDEQIPAGGRKNLPSKSWKQHATFEAKTTQRCVLKYFSKVADPQRLIN